MRPWRLVLFLLATSCLAQTPRNCEIGRATGTLDASGVEVSYPMTGGIAYSPPSSDPRLAAHYFVPKESRLSPLYAANIWVGGTVEGEFRVAGATYGQGGPDNEHFEFWPGPLDEGATLPNPDDCSAYDRIWVVSVDDVEAYERTGVATDDLLTWPVGLGAEAVDASGRPLVVTGRDQSLDLGAGERPVVFGTQTAFWILNDVGNEHRSTGSLPLGIEVAVTAFVVSSPVPIFDQSSFMRYRITNRSDRDINDLLFTLWADPDLGDGGDDFVGVDTTRSLAYVYNADEPDQGGYGLRPPAFGVRVLGGDASPEESHRLGAFAYGQGGNANRRDPGNAAEYRRSMNGRWPDGTPIREIGNGYSRDVSAPSTAFAFPGDPTLGHFWSEERPGIYLDPYYQVGDRRFWATTRPVSLASGASTEVDLAFVFAQGDSRLGSLYDLFQQSDVVQAAYDDGSLFATQPRYVPPPPTPPILAIDLLAGPNPARERLTLRVRLPRMAPARLSLYDARGRALVVTDRAQWPAGQTEVEIPTASLAPGTYLARLDVRGGASITRTITVVR